MECNTDNLPTEKGKKISVQLELVNFLKLQSRKGYKGYALRKKVLKHFVV